MKRGLKNYLQNKGVDSVQKLHLLLFLQRHPLLQGTIQELAQRLYFGDIVLLNKILADLQFAELIERIGSRYKLRDAPEVKLYLDALARLFEDPLARQELLQALPS